MYTRRNFETATDGGHGSHADGDQRSHADGSQGAGTLNPIGPSRAELRGRAAGNMMLACFALGWTGCGISSFPNVLGISIFIVAAAASATIVALAIRSVRRAPTSLSTVTAPSPASASDTGPAIGRRYGLIVTAEFLGIFATVRILAATNHPTAISAAIATIVGIHFFPLARLFGVPAYDRTGTALCVAGLAAFALAPLTGTAALWTLIPGFGSATVLYATCTHLLRV
jgi:hypothetical protein